jgi:uncharacterized peroxidase-related enzyme
MSNRIQLLSQCEASEKSQQLLAQVQKKFGSVPNVFRMMSNSSAVLQSYLSFSQALSEGQLCPQIQERIALAIAEENGCEYCLAAHSTIAKKAGLSEEEIQLARRGKSEDQRAQAAIKFSKSVFLYSGDVKDSEFEEIKEAGFSEEEILEIVAAVSLNVLTNSLNNVAQTKLDFPEAKELAGCGCNCGCSS